MSECGAYLAGLVCQLPKGHSGPHDDLSDHQLNRQRISESEERLINLESELERLRAENLKLQQQLIELDHCRDIANKTEAMEKENSRLSKDAARLELCIQLRSFPKEYFKSYNPPTDSLGWKWFYTPESGYQESARDCIDLALQAIAQKGAV